MCGLTLPFSSSLYMPAESEHIVSLNTAKIVLVSSSSGPGLAPPLLPVLNLPHRSRPDLKEASPAHMLSCHPPNGRSHLVTLFPEATAAGQQMAPQPPQ